MWRSLNLAVTSLHKIFHRLYKYINQEILDELISRTTQLSKKISSFITYLKKSEFKGSKFHVES
jgi:hypothetical protein